MGFAWTNMNYIYLLKAIHKKRNVYNSKCEVNLGSIRPKSRANSPTKEIENTFLGSWEM